MRAWLRANAPEVMLHVSHRDVCIAESEIKTRH